MHMLVTDLIIKMCVINYIPSVVVMGGGGGGLRGIQVSCSIYNYNYEKYLLFFREY